MTVNDGLRSSWIVMSSNPNISQLWCLMNRSWLISLLFWWLWLTQQGCIDDDSLMVDVSPVVDIPTKTIYSFCSCLRGCSSGEWFRIILESSTIVRNQVLQYLHSIWSKRIRDHLYKHKLSWPYCVDFSAVIFAMSQRTQHEGWKTSTLRKWYRTGSALFSVARCRKISGFSRAGTLIDWIESVPIRR